MNIPIDRLNNPSQWAYRNVRDVEHLGGPAVYHYFERDDGTVVTVALSEGGHIMKGKAGEWYITEHTNRSGPELFRDDETQALIAAVEMANWVDIRDDARVDKIPPAPV